MARQDYFTHFKKSIVRWGRKREITKKNHLITRKQNVACLTCDLSDSRTQSGEMTSDLER